MPLVPASGRRLGSGLFPVRRELVAGLALVVLTAAVLGGVCACDFVNYDDDIYVTGNLAVLQGLSLDGIRWAFTATRSNHWHPLTWLSLQRDVESYGGSDGLAAWGFHLTNLLLHLANVVLLFALLRQMTGAVGRSFAAAALFAIHPLHVESVAWITERKDVLSTFFWLLTMVAYVHYVRSPGWRPYVAVIVAYVLGLLAKPMLVTLPFALLLIDWWPLGRVPAPSGRRGGLYRWGRPVLEKLPLFALGAASALVSLVARSAGGGIKSAEYWSLGARFGFAANAYVVYLGKTLWPVGLAAFYPVPPGGLSVGRIAAEAALIVALTAGVLRARTRRPYLVVGWLWYLGTLLPVSGVVQLGSYAYADRYTYVPSIGLFVGLVWWSADALASKGRERVLALPFVVVVALLSVASWPQVATWRNSVCLWEHALAVTPDNFFARTHLGMAYQEVGRLDRAGVEFEAALALRPDLALAADNLGTLRMRQGRLRDAESCFRRATEQDSGEARYRVHLEDALRRTGKSGAGE